MVFDFYPFYVVMGGAAQQSRIIVLDLRTFDVVEPK